MGEMKGQVPEEDRRATARHASFWGVLALSMAGIAIPAEPAINLPCAPSRACAIEMARAAAYENERRSKGNLGEMFGLLAVARVQLDSGDIAGFTAAAAEARRAIEHTMVQAAGLDHLAEMFARAGMFDQALGTAAAARTPFEREMAYRRVAEEFARRGRWREALAARLSAHSGHAEYSNYIVMKDLVQTRRRDWVMDALPTLAPGREAEVLTELERLSGNLDAAREQAVRIVDPEKRWTPLFEIAKVGTESGRWNEVAAVARIAAAEGLNADTEHVRNHRIIFAIEWFSAARQFDEALALVSKYPEAFNSPGPAAIVSGMIAAGEYARAGELMRSLSSDYLADMRGKLAIARVLEGEQHWKKVLPAFPVPAERLAALMLLGEKLPDSRTADARAVLRAAARVAESLDARRTVEIADAGELQARRGFVDDARATAVRIGKSGDTNRVFDLCRLHGAIMKAQAARGDPHGARKTFASIEPLLHRAEVNGYAHAKVIDDLTTAKLMPEAYAQVQAISRRAHDDRWYDADLFPLIRAHVEAGELRRAFEIAVMLSEHDYGNPDYFLEIARAIDR